MNSNAGQYRWWHGAALYQLYVRSWRDSDGDGYGDLGGVIDGLDYLSWLGVDGIWLSPTMPSPDDDWGYDVSDYLGVHPDLGTMADMDRLIAKAGRRGLRVLLDLVPNHTSSAHAWFADAAGSRDARHRDTTCGRTPGRTVARRTTGWTRRARAPGPGTSRPGSTTCTIPAQPARPELVEAGRARRVRRDSPVLAGPRGGRVPDRRGAGPVQGREAARQPAGDAGGPLGGRFGQQPVYNQNRPEVHGVYRDWRRIAAGYPQERLLLGETWVGDLGQLAAYYGRDDELQLAFNFPFVFAPFTAPELSGVVARTLASLPARVCPVWTASNHDVGRFPSRWCGGDERRSGWPCWCWPRCPGRPCSTTGTRSA